MILCNYIAPTFRETPCGGVDWALNAFYGLIQGVPFLVFICIYASFFLRK